MAPEPSRDDVRYHHRAPQPTYAARSPRYAPQYVPPPVAARPYQRQAFAVPPPVERYATHELPRSNNVPPSEGSPKYARSGMARWMGRSWRGHKTASGEMFEPDLMTGAHHSLPLPSFVYVTNKSNNRTVLIRVNDRVPAASGRAVIVSEKVASLLGFRRAGSAAVDIQYAGPASPTPSGKYEAEFLSKQSWYRTGHAPARNVPVGASRSSGRYPQPNYPRWDNSQR